MNGFKRALPVGVVVALLSGVALAEVDLDVRSDRVSRVYLGSQYVGDTPLVLRGVKPGTHQVLVEDTQTREVRTFMIPSPEELLVERRLDVRWGYPTSYPVAVGSVPTTVVVPVRVPPPPAPAPARAESVGKTHTRNVFVGATVLSQILTKDSRDRKRQRNVGLGAIGLNELFRK